MLIPKIFVVVTQGGRSTDLRASVDTGYDGVAVIRPALARQLNIPIVGTQRLRGFGGTLNVPVGTADALAIKDSPACILKNAKVVITDMPGTEEILLGEGFFNKFSFDIKYLNGQPVIVACGERVSTWSDLTSSPWFIPGVIIGGLALVSIVASAFLDEEPNRRR
jgi:predicted aspartyl protease